MRVHYVDYHLYPHTVSFIDQPFELKRSSQSGRYTEVVGTVVSKGAIVWVLYHPHYLNNIVPQASHSGQHYLSEVVEAVHFLAHPCHPDVALIHLYSIVRPCWPRVIPLIVSQLHIHSIEGTVAVLTREVNPSGDTVAIGTVLKLYLHFEGTVRLNFFVDCAGP